MRVKDKVAVVTGGSSGIGEATVFRLSEEGAKVAIIDMNLEGAKKVADNVKERAGECMALQANVTNRVEVQAAIREVLAQFGVIDILVNNAGISIASPADEMAEEIWDRVLDVNLKGYFLCAQAVIPQMKQRRYGKIVNTASRLALGGTPNLAHYSASKAGVLGLMRALAEELGPFNINVNSIGPALIGVQRTLSRRTPDEWQAMGQSNFLRRPGTPRDIANAVLFLASDEASYITGQCLYVCGGRSSTQVAV